MRIFIRRAYGSADFLWEFGGEKVPFQGKKHCFNVGCAHNFLRISGVGCKMIQNIKNLKKSVDKRCLIVYNRYCCEGHNKVLKTTNQLKGSIAQLGEHLPYKQRVTG
ncbi:hypothetical protein, partial [uncultured Ruminococcus sp.]|uniref:hypothetical protein n=1 Tax=uncultured Ruminococcus sp. TaxID=165186 RepID=UPI002633D02B